MIPQKKHDNIRRSKTVLASAALYIINWGLSNIELIINAANQSSRTLWREKEAAMGIVPYIHKGEAMPKRLEKTRPKIPYFFWPGALAELWMLSFKNTDTAEPRAMPSTQYRKIWRSCTSK